MKRISFSISILICCLICGKPYAQTLGGNSIYNFLKLPNTPQLNALGGTNISTISQDAGMAFNAPCLLRESMKNQLDLSFNSLYGGIKDYSGLYAGRIERWNTNIAAGVHFFDYGEIPQTDAAGNILGSFQPSDYVVQFVAARHYEKKWFYGVTLKFVHSSYGIYRSSGLALDLGGSYYDSSALLQISLVARNMGMQLKKYQGSTSGELPFDLEAGITKRLEKAPLQFSLTIHDIQQFNIRYNDTAYNIANNLASADGSPFTLDKLFRHFIFAVQAYPANLVEITASYNYSGRKELSIENTPNGLTGFALGLGVLVKKWQFRYARSFFQNNITYNQFGLQFNVNQLFNSQVRK